MLHLLSYRSSGVEESVEVNEVEFSMDRYEPMNRLMSEEDLLFLKAQPGFRPEMAKKFVRERRRIFRLYLQELASDFHRLHAYARSVVATLPAEHSPLVGLLLRQQVRFWYEMAAIEMRLSFAWLGAATFDARALVQSLATMHAEISRASIAAAAA
jgi:hypothetical protein